MESNQNLCFMSLFTVPDVGLKLRISQLLDILGPEIRPDYFLYQFDVFACLQCAIMIFN